MLRFAKYHGCGNDFVILTEGEAGSRPYPELAKKLCHRQLGIGADGLIIVRQDPLEMIFYNSDGSRAPMCGNGIRCFAKYCFDEGIRTEEQYPVETLAGTMGVRIASKDPFLVEINMGIPDYDPKKCGIRTDQTIFMKQQLQLKNRSLEVSSCFIGTIHTVVWMNSLEGEDLEQLGSEISNHPLYAEKTNVNFVQIVNSKTLKLITFERGAGMTFACGTGACASVVIGAAEGKCDRNAQVLLQYGKLFIEQRPNDEVMMTGPAVRTVQGCFEEDREE
jgi:diaminopimelate epimerase